MLHGGGYDGDYVLYAVRRDVTINAEKWGTLVKYGNGVELRAHCNAEFVASSDGGRGVPVRATRDIREHEEVLVWYGDEYEWRGAARA